MRYRYDANRKLRYKTVELIVETAPWSPRTRQPRHSSHDMVMVKLSYGETELRHRIKEAGGIWRPQARLWEIDWETVQKLGLEKHVSPDDRVD